MAKIYYGGIGVHPLKSQYFDHILPFLRYHFEVQGDGSYDLVIDNLLDKAVDAIAALFGDRSQSLGALVNAQGGEMRIKDFIPANLHGNFAVSYFGEQQSELNGLGKLNMVFKKANPLGSVQTLKISAIENAIAGALSANPLIDAAYTAAANDNEQIGAWREAAFCLNDTITTRDARTNEYKEVA